MNNRIDELCEKQPETLALEDPAELSSGPLASAKITPGIYCLVRQRNVTLSVHNTPDSNK